MWQMIGSFIGKYLSLLIYPPAAVLISAVLTLWCIRVLPRLGMIDVPRGRHEHSKPTPLGGGIAIVVGFFAVSLIFALENRAAHPEVLRALCARFGQATVVTCPESNLHLEGQLPPLPEWRRLGLHVAMGTDSLASATQLSMLHNINLALDTFAELPFVEVLRWATLGGAEALGLETQLGSIAVGKQPGLCLIEQFDFAFMRPSPQSTVRRLA